MLNLAMRVKKVNVMLGTSLFFSNALYKLLYKYSSKISCHFQKAWNEETRDAWESLLMVVIETMEIAITEGDD